MSNHKQIKPTAEEAVSQSLGLATEAYDKCLDHANTAYTSAVRVYDIIREVGYGKLSADNALHRLVEDYKNMRELGKELVKLSKQLDQINRLLGGR